MRRSSSVARGCTTRASAGSRSPEPASTWNIRPSPTTPSGRRVADQAFRSRVIQPSWKAGDRRASRFHLVATGSALRVEVARLAARKHDRGSCGRSDRRRASCTLTYSTMVYPPRGQARGGAGSRVPGQRSSGDRTDGRRATHPDRCLATPMARQSRIGAGRGRRQFSPAPCSSPALHPPRGGAAYGPLSASAGSRRVRRRACPVRPALELDDSSRRRRSSSPSRVPSPTVAPRSPPGDEA